ncbi:hypothetical protein ISN45_Aa08g011000 [Arabidopsis thaliana x Arabidopsis arenosa]|uniref:Uncharacterized protein n=1 Tax=Arabidopsis thaliana x Arabidopsis arenosa TaxID=1240361 RepID=A0A8T1XG02_9BRAS|nr:hypothetical protein ISN45_Aa08g011000 [Arabidopsis thaliana x Arabidopsis arenosa]
MATKKILLNFVTIMVDFVASSPMYLKTMVVKEDEAHHPYTFHVSVPSNVASPNWRDLINSSWKHGSVTQRPIPAPESETGAEASGSAWKRDGIAVPKNQLLEAAGERSIRIWKRSDV